TPHLAHWGPFVTTPPVQDASASVQVKTRVRNESSAVANCTLATSILDRDGKVVSTAEAAQEIGANGEYEFMQVARVEKPNLWSPDTPYLYTIRSTVRDRSG